MRRMQGMQTEGGPILARVADRVTGLLLWLLASYQRWISPMFGPSCRFHPTCSTFAAQAIERYGPLSGSARAIARLSRCHPLSAGGHDPVS